LRKQISAGLPQRIRPVADQLAADPAASWLRS